MRYSLEALTKVVEDVIKDIKFPAEEIQSLRPRNTIVTHRVSDDANKYDKGDYVYAEEVDDNYCFEIVDKTVIHNVEDSKYYSDLTEGQRKYLKKFDYIAVLTLKKTKYERPYKLSTIKAKYPPKVYKMIAADPCHSWRARTGIDMIHLEPDDAEQKRTCSNWRLLPDRYKRVSDQKSVEIFGCDNLSHEKTLVIDRLKKEFSRLQYGLRDPKTGKPWMDTHNSTTIDDDFEVWRLATPEETISAGCGVCYDTVAMSIAALKKTPIKYKAYFLCGENYNHDSAAHTTVIYEDPTSKKWMWLEGSWGQFKTNDWKAPSSDALISWIAKAMANSSKTVIEVRELKAYPKYGCDMMTFEKFCLNFKISKVVKPD